MPENWAAGLDIGKEHHHCVVIDAKGERLLSRRVLNDEAELLELIGDVLALSADAHWSAKSSAQDGCCHKHHSCRVY
ncbi:IS110 family transposase [Streptomyces sp. DT203]|uniref:IS110 family transposase n=1 Tax=Streptomyces sp. DT203 TaxID=3393424 RepID=UPI003CE780D9